MGVIESEIDTVDTEETIDDVDFAEILGEDESIDTVEVDTDEGEIEDVDDVAVLDTDSPDKSDAVDGSIIVGVGMSDTDLSVAATSMATVEGELGSGVDAG